MPKLSKKLPDDKIPDKTLQFISTSPSKITTIKLEKFLSQKFDLEKEQIKSVIGDLVKRGELVYTYEYGRSYLECSFNKPVRVSKFVVIKPPGCHYRPHSNDIVIQIEPGASFGDGRHPSTCLAIRAIEVVLTEIKIDDPVSQHTVLDIGTGSGILVLTAIRFGIHNGLGIDIDPVARSEAKENIRLNGLEDRIGISDQYLETIDKLFSLVTANLRFPTLKKICSCLRKITAPNGFVVVSGIRRHESAELIKAYSRKGFGCLWQDHEFDWAGVAFRKL